MKPEYKIGEKIKYCLFDPKGKKHWFDGVIHGVRRYEDPATNVITKVTYLVDTGRNTKLDIITTEEGQDDIKVRQPEQLELESDKIQTR